MSEFDLRALLKALNQKDVKFVVIGGVAVAAHGYVRGTEDLDLVPDPDPVNLERLSSALNGLGARLPTAEGRPFNSATDARVLVQGGNLTADTRYGGLDIVQRAHGVPRYSDLVAEAVESDLLGVPVAICSLQSLRAMKQAAGRSQDRADLDNLSSTE